VLIVAAAWTGCRYAGISRAVPSVTVDVRCAIDASSVSGSRRGRTSESPTHTESKPSRSAAAAVSTTLAAVPPERSWARLLGRRIP
jgi:hypothetical protein